MKILKTYVCAITFAFFLTGCNPGSEERRQISEEQDGLETNEEVTVEQSDEENKKTVTAMISSASGSNVTGQATFTSTGENKIKFELTVENVPEGSHAVHLHENGDCSASDASSAGGHWNPTDQPHGKRGTQSFHKGDIGNMDVGSDGKGTMSMTIEGWCIGGAEDCNILNKAVIIHAEGDDFTSQPSGAAGDRIACGVIKSNG